MIVLIGVKVIINYNGFRMEGESDDDGEEEEGDNCDGIRQLSSSTYINCDVHDKSDWDNEWRSTLFCRPLIS